MQINDESIKRRDRGNVVNLELAAAVPGIDVILAGHTDSGARTALIDPVNGTYIMQTFGQGQNLGVFQLVRSQTSWSMLASKLDGVTPDEVEANEVVATKLAAYEARFAEIFESTATVVCT